jgi:predicted nucleic acid-binding protein
VAVSGWLLDKSAAVRSNDPSVSGQLAELADKLYVCQMGELEQLYSARSGRDYDRLQQAIHDGVMPVTAPPDIFERALRLQRDLAHHHGLWHRMPILDLFIAETALHHNFGVVHIDGAFERIAEVRPLVVRRLA